jgi:hypothetical protein
LTTHREVTTVTYPSITTNILQTTNILAHLTPQLAFNTVVLIDELSQTTRLGLGEFSDPCVRVYPRVIQDLVAPGATNTVNIGQSNLDSLVARQVNTCYSGHIFRLPWWFADIF